MRVCTCVCVCALQIFLAFFVLLMLVLIAIIIYFLCTCRDLSIAFFVGSPQLKKAPLFSFDCLNHAVCAVICLLVSFSRVDGSSLFQPSRLPLSPSTCISVSTALQMGAVVDAALSPASGWDGYGVAVTVCLHFAFVLLVSFFVSDSGLEQLIIFVRGACCVHYPPHHPQRPVRRPQKPSRASADSTGIWSE